MRPSHSSIRLLLGGLLLVCALLGCRSQGNTLQRQVSSAEPPKPAPLVKLQVVDDVTFLPAAPILGQDIRATVKTAYTLQHFEFRYLWLKNGVPVEGVDGNVWPGKLGAAGDVLKVQVIPYDEEGVQKTFLSSYVVIGKRAKQNDLGEGQKCEKDAQCASGSCGIGDGGMRCIGNAPHNNRDLALTPAMLERLEKETTITLSQTAKPERIRRSASQSLRRSGWSSSRARGGSASGARGALQLGESCSHGGYCRSGLLCKGVRGMATCVPSGR